MSTKYTFKTLDGLETIPLTKKQAKSIQLIARLSLAGLLFAGGYFMYKSEIKENGSIKKAYESFNKQIERIPPLTF